MFYFILYFYVLFGLYLHFILKKACKTYLFQWPILIVLGW